MVLQCLATLGGGNQYKDGTVSYLLADGQVDSGATYSISGDKSTFQGVNGTIKLGYNKQLDTNFIGVEFGATWQDAKANGLAIVPSAIGNQVPGSTKVNTYETISGRLGHIFNENTLVYVTGGAAIGQIKSKLSDLVVNNWTYAPYDSLSDSKTELGYTIGFGAEHKLSNQLSLRANYEYVNFGNVNFNYLQPYIGPPGLGSDATSITQSSSIHFSNLSAGISYAF